MSSRSRDEARPLPKGTRERLACCEAVGLHWWADHPKAGHVWAVDDHQKAHVVQIRRDGTAHHVCRPDLLVEEERCTAGIDEIARDTAKPPGAA
jgi:hypothetical protein